MIQVIERFPPLAGVATDARFSIRLPPSWVIQILPNQAQVTANLLRS